MSCHLQLGIGLLDMGREITSLQAWPKSMSNYDGRMCIYNFTCGSLQSLINFLPEQHVGTSVIFLSLCPSPIPWCLLTDVRLDTVCAVISTWQSLPMSSTSIKARIKSTPRPVRACSPATEGAWSPESCPVRSEGLPAHQQCCKLMSCTNIPWSSWCYSLQSL